jgi:hypothetical protein
VEKRGLGLSALPEALPSLAPNRRWKDPEFLAEKVDVIIDCVGAGGHYGKSLPLLKSAWKVRRVCGEGGDWGRRAF